MFIDKAVAIWTGKSDLDHISTVGDYLHFSGGNYLNNEIRAIDLTPSSILKAQGDPLYVVIARKE